MLPAHSGALAGARRRRARDEQSTPTPASWSHSTGVSQELCGVRGLRSCAADERRRSTRWSAIRRGIATTDVSSDQLACLWNLVRLEANPEVVQRFMPRVVPAIGRLDAEGRWPYFGVSGFLASVSSRRHCAKPAPDVSNVITTSLADVSTVDRARRIVDLRRPGPKAAPRRTRIILCARFRRSGRALAAAASARGKDARRRQRVAQQLLCDHAALVAPSVVTALTTADATAARALVRVLGIAGAGYEAPIASQLQSSDEQTVREALREPGAGSARRGRRSACGSAVNQPTQWLSGAAAETLWHFPAAEARRQVLELLSQRDFVQRSPEVAGRLSIASLQGGAHGLRRFSRRSCRSGHRVRSPALARVGRRAHVLLQQLRAAMPTSRTPTELSPTDPLTLPQRPRQPPSPDRHVSCRPSGDRAEAR